jgi:Tol biopolymer transport system component
MGFFDLIYCEALHHQPQNHREEVMIRSRILLLVPLVLLSSIGVSQIKVTRTDKLALPRTHTWSHPQFSPTGASVYFTDSDGNGIWEYSLKSRSTRQITADAKSGLAYSISSDGKSLVYRRTQQDKVKSGRRQDIVLTNLTKRSTSILASGSDVSIPTFSNNVPVYTLRSQTIGLKKTANTSAVSVLGIENMKIALSINGEKVMLDPLGNGSYIWPVLSPDHRQLVAYEMGKGTFVCDLTGKVQSMLGRRDAPSWTRTGKWIVYMEDKDDGHKLISSDVCAVSPDGQTVVYLTSTTTIMELDPHCSPTENKIICSTSDGGIVMLEYEERP